MATVTVIIPTYNMGETLSRSITSALLQNINKEIIIVNDGSQDNTKAIIENFLPYITSLHQDNKGKASAVNNAVKHATGEYTTILDADDTLPSKSLERRVEFLENNKEYAAVYTDAALINKDKIIGYKRSQSHEELPNKLLQSTVPFTTATGLYKTTAIKKIGFNEKLKRTEDIDFLIRFTQQFQMGYLDKTTYNYHIDTHTANKKIAYRIQSIKERKRIIASHFNNQRSLLLKTYITESMKLAYEVFSNNKIPLYKA